MNVLVVPTSDWLGHPVPSRLHYIFEIIGRSDDVYVLRFAFENYRKIKTKLYVEEINDVRINNIAWYYLLNVKRHYEAVRQIIAKRHIDVVVISNLLSGFVSAKAAKNAGAIVFDLPDHFPTSGAGYYFDVQSVPGKFGTAFLEGILKRTLNNVDHVVTCSNVLQDYVRRLGFDNVSLIPNGVHDFFFDGRESRSSKRAAYGLDEDIVVGYIGSIEFWLDVLPLLKAIKKLRKSYDVKLMFVGGKLRTQVTEEIRREIEKLGIEEQVLWVDFVPFNSVPEYISSMDICTIPFNHLHPTAYYSSPNKLFEYLALEKPVISTPIPEVLNIAKNYVNFAVTDKDYFNIIKNYIEHPDIFIEKAREGKKLAIERKWSKIAQNYKCLLEDVFYKK